MTYRGTDNLRCYIREATLPPMLNDPTVPTMPPDGHKSHRNHLQVRPESWRKLASMYGLNEDVLERNIGLWVDTYIPEESCGVEDEDRSTGERLSIPCPPIFDIPPQQFRRPTDVRRLSPWLDNLPLMTVQRILHILFPDTRDWGFHPSDDNDHDKIIFQYYLWTLSTDGDQSPGATRDIGSHSVVLAFQPPWVLSCQDMKEFAQCRSLPPFRIPGHAFPSPLKSHERLWAKMWDICVRKSCQWFVLTSYNQWVFGVFSKGWTAAFVSCVYNFDDYSPTILEHLTFWVASAMGIPGTSRAPQVPEPVRNLGPFSIPPPHETDFSTPAPSESNWEGKSEDAGSSAGVDDTLSPIISETGLPGWPIPLNRPVHPFQRVKTWMQKTDSRVVTPDIPSSPARSLVSTPTTTQTALYQGDWLA